MRGAAENACPLEPRGLGKGGPPLTRCATLDEWLGLCVSLFLHLQDEKAGSPRPRLRDCYRTQSHKMCRHHLTQSMRCWLFHEHCLDSRDCAKC